MRLKIIHSFGILLKQCIVSLFFLLLVPGISFCEEGKAHVPESINKILTLNEAITIALKNNRSLQRSRLSLASSNLNVQLQNEKFDVKIIPTSSVNYNSSNNQFWSAGVKFFKQTEIGISGSITPQIEESHGIKRSSVELMLNVPLLRGLGTAYNLDGLYGSLYTLESARMAHYKQQDSLVINTVTSVYGVINLQKQIDLLLTQIEGLKRHISLTELKERTGLASTMDMYRAELRFKEVQNQLTILEKRFEANVDRLKKLLGSSMQNDLIVTASIDYQPITVHLDDAIAIALENRIEIEQAIRKSEEAKRKVTIARHDILPIVDLHLGYKRNDKTESTFLDEEDWIISLNGSSELFRSAARTTYEQANISYKQSKIDIESSREDVIREVRAQINQMKKIEQLIVDRGEQLHQAQGKLELALSKFNHQLADNFDLLEAQTQKQQVETDLLFDSVGYIVDTYKLRSILGTLIKR
jgi:outer membrane protein TolC